MSWESGKYLTKFLCASSNDETSAKQETNEVLSVKKLDLLESTGWCHNQRKSYGLRSPFKRKCKH
ncbi:CLUMA_CG019655, isoform A [Clunio marinus]|uniref:CLUMA_CG019655, isoform A n=1 Tax=Clunio marinus TaxID=568069 RepID=A0A1J1J3L0_9DIPT|nr:CLUMA_CG019655, isoform A [Clunio marinus]